MFSLEVRTVKWLSASRWSKRWNMKMASEAPPWAWRLWEGDDMIQVLEEGTHARRWVILNVKVYFDPAIWRPTESRFSGVFCHRFASNVLLTRWQTVVGAADRLWLVFLGSLHVEVPRVNPLHFECNMWRIERQCNRKKTEKSTQKNQKKKKKHWKNTKENPQSTVRLDAASLSSEGNPARFKG